MAVFVRSVSSVQNGTRPNKNSRFLKLGVVLTNAHIIWNPLRASDGSFYDTVPRLVLIGESA